MHYDADRDHRRSLVVVRDWQWIDLSDLGARHLRDDARDDRLRWHLRDVCRRVDAAFVAAYSSADVMFH